YRFDLEAGTRHHRLRAAPPSAGQSLPGGRFHPVIQTKTRLSGTYSPFLSDLSAGFTNGTAHLGVHEFHAVEVFRIRASKFTYCAESFRRAERRLRRLELVPAIRRPEFHRESRPRPLAIAFRAAHDKKGTKSGPRKRA